jgi:hypothetical protein
MVNDLRPMESGEVVVNRLSPVKRIVGMWEASLSGPKSHISICGLITDGDRNPEIFKYSYKQLIVIVILR